MAGNNGNTLGRLTNLADGIADDLTAARAIMDAAKILATVERFRAQPIDGCLETGEGVVDGRTLRDRTLPDLLEHGIRLLDSVKRQTNEVDRLTRHPMAQAANG